MILIICQAINLKRSSRTYKFLYLIGISTLFAFILDCCAAIFGWWSNGFMSKNAFLAVVCPTDHCCEGEKQHRDRHKIL
jgi:hypothetical protein